jgi:serine/threonine protein kinase
MNSKQFLESNIYTFLQIILTIKFRGAFGKVIQAIKKDDNQFYAIKMVAKSELDDEDLKNLQFELTVLDKVIFLRSKNRLTIQM